MRPLLLACALMLSCSAASAFPVSAPKSAAKKAGTGCTGALKTLAPRLRTCPIKGEKKSRIWCPDGTAFDLDDAIAPAPLARSLCNLTQVAD